MRVYYIYDPFLIRSGQYGYTQIGLNIGDYMMCAVSPDGWEEGACQGDSGKLPLIYLFYKYFIGGPLMFMRGDGKTIGQHYEQIGSHESLLYEVLSKSSYSQRDSFLWGKPKRSNYCLWSSQLP